MQGVPLTAVALCVNSVAGGPLGLGDRRTLQRMVSTVAPLRRRDG